MRTTSALLLLILVLPTSYPALAATSESQLVIYVETAAEIPLPARLELGAVSLQSATGTTTLQPVRRVIDSAELTGTQQLLVDQPVAPGHYDSLRLDLEGITTHVGQAPVRPELPLDGVTIPADLEVPDGECTFLILRWQPRTPAETGPHVPDLAIHRPLVPPLGSLIFVTNERSNNVTVIDHTSGRVVDCIAVGGQPRGIAYSPLDRLLFVALAGDDAVAVIEAASRRRLQTVPMRFGDEPSRLMVVPEEHRLYVLNRGSDTITVLSTPGMQDMGRIPVSPGPRSLTRDPGSGYLYIACETAGEVVVYDAATRRQVTSLAVDTTPTELAFDDSRQQLHVASGLRRRVLIVDVATGETTAQIDLCAVAEGLVLAPVSRRLYAAAGRCRQVSVLTPSANMEIRAIDLDGAPGLMALSADRRRILATLPAVDRLAICNVTGSRVEFTIETGRQPYAVIAP